MRCGYFFFGKSEKRVLFKYLVRWGQLYEYATVTSTYAEAYVAYGNTGSKIGRTFSRRPQLASFKKILPRKSLKQMDLDVAAELIVRQMMLLQQKNVVLRLELWARGWLSLALFSWLA